MSFSFFKDIIHLSNTEVPVEPVQSALMEGLVLERQKRAVQDMEPVQDQLPYLPDPCDPNPCQNDGVCVNVKGKASCRYHRLLPPCPGFLLQAMQLKITQSYRPQRSKPSGHQEVVETKYFTTVASSSQQPGGQVSQHSVVLPGCVNSLLPR